MLQSPGQSKFAKAFECCALPNFVYGFFLLAVINQKSIVILDEVPGHDQRIGSSGYHSGL